MYTKRCNTFFKQRVQFRVVAIQRLPKQTSLLSQTFYDIQIRLNINYVFMEKTKTKTSIRYAKENDRKKTERRRERERKVEGEIQRGRER